jgi:Lrp/AsnC family leucine-responsive transcriptional regulator
MAGLLGAAAGYRKTSLAGNGRNRLVLLRVKGLLVQQYVYTQVNGEINMQATLDRTDLRILATLQTHGRITNAELAAEINLSPSACLRRMQKLEADGVIAGYGARLEPRSLGLGLQAFVRVQLSRHEAEAIDQFTERVAEWDEVVSCYALTGDMDYLLQVYVADLEGFSRFLLDRLLNAAGVADVNTSFVLRTVKASTALPLGNVAV